MSSDEKKPYDVARQIGESALQLLAGTTEWIGLAGSVRRQKHAVGDIEIVAKAQDSRRLLARLDKLVIDKVITKARYGDTGYRWGDKYRGFLYQGMRVEVFCADAHNFGYIYWLRTGPGDANQEVMTQLSWRNSPYRAEGSYWWHKGQKISVPDETEMFRLLGMSYILPAERTLEKYKFLLKSWKPVPASTLQIVDTKQSTQQTLF